MKINEMVEEVHQVAKEHGWWEKPRAPLEIYALIHSEISEAVEEARKGNPAVYVHNVDGTKAMVETIDSSSFFRFETDVPSGKSLVTPIKPEGELIEIADAVIRCMDYCGHKGWDLEKAIRAKHEFNKTRPYRHGNKLA